MKRITSLTIIFIVLCMTGYLSHQVGTEEITSESPIKLKIVTLKHTQQKGKDTLPLVVSTNLPPGAILNCQVESLVYSLKKPNWERHTVCSYLIEIDNEKQAKGEISSFSWTLPAGVYVVKLGLAEKQRQKVIKQLPKEYLGKTLLQQEVFVNTIKNALKNHQEQLEELQDTWSFYESMLKSLEKFIGLHNSRELKSRVPEVEKWHTEVYRRMDTTLDKMALYSFPEFPGLYRLSYEFSTEVGSALRSQELSVFHSITGRTEPGENSPPQANDPKPEFAKITLQGDFAAQLNKGKSTCLKEAIFDLMLILKYSAQEMGLSYQNVYPLADKQDLWEKENNKFQETLGEFNNYFRTFQKNHQPDKFNSVYEMVSAYQDHLKKLLEIYASLVKEGEKEPLTQTLKETLTATDELFQKTHQVLNQP